MKILFLHLSDLHLRTDADVNLECVGEIGKALSAQSIGDIDQIIVLVTGDIAFSGRAIQYEAFRKLKNALISSLRSNVSSNYIHVFVVPGNHDINYDTIQDYDRAYYEELIRNADTSDLIAEIKARSAYFRCVLSNYSIEKHNPFMKRVILDIDGFTIEVNLLNSSFFSLMGQNDQGLHYLPAQTIAELQTPTGADMVITLMHHSHQWFNEKCNVALEQTLLEKNTMIFYGHEHYLAEKTITYNEVAPAHIFCGGCLCENGNWTQSKFFACVYDTELQEYSLYEFKWDATAKIYHKDSKEEKKPLVAKCSADIPKSINQSFVNNLTKDSLVKLSDNLSDYYVFPGVGKVLERKSGQANDILSFNQFYEEFEKLKRLEISGVESSGKSALLKMIFKHYLYRKCILLCSVEDISSGNRKRIIKSLFESTYGERPSDYDKFERLDKSQKIILIDDLHLIDPKHVSGFLSGIEEDFGYIIYTTNNTLKLDIQERIKACILKESYTCYRMLPLYSDKRKELVEKVIPLKNPNIPSEDLFSLTDKITQSLNLQRRYIPLTPEIILHFIDYYLTYQLEATQNDGSIFSKVFESSITNVLDPHIKSPVTVDKAFTILGKIAFYIHKNKKYPITHKEIIDVIMHYCEEYGSKIDSIDFIASIVASHIICKYGDEGTYYKFCNNNYLAYFVAHEICANRDTIAVQDCLEKACFGINSVILMFITYLTHDQELIEAILVTANTVTSEWEEFSFDMQELSHLNRMVLSGKKIEAPSEEDRMHHQKIDAERDRAELENATVDILSIYDYNEEDIAKLEHQFTRAISLLVVLARCLPNFEHRLKKREKEALVEALYQLPNKIFWAWACEVEKGKEELIQLIREMPTNEVTRRNYTEDKAKDILQQQSLSLLLELYYSVAENAYRKNSLEYLTDMAMEKVDFSAETHTLQLLTFLDKAQKITEFKNVAVKFRDSTNKPIAKRALDQIVYHLLVKGKLPLKQASQIEQEFFPKGNRTALVYGRKIAERKN